MDFTGEKMMKRNISGIEWMSVCMLSTLLLCMTVLANEGDTVAEGFGGENGIVLYSGWNLVAAPGDLSVDDNALLFNELNPFALDRNSMTYVCASLPLSSGEPLWIYSDSQREVKFVHDESDSVVAGLRRGDGWQLVGVGGKDEIALNHVLAAWQWGNGRWSPLEIHDGKVLLSAGRGYFISREASESDGLPDDWKIRYFKTTDVRADDDADGDGVTNLEEYQYGTDPTSKDIFEIHVINGDANMEKAWWGDMVTIYADDLSEEDMLFDKWVSDDVELEDVSSPVATFVMPAKNVTVTATYIPKPELDITGADVLSALDNPSGVEFLKFEYAEASKTKHTEDGEIRYEYDYDDKGNIIYNVKSSGSTSSKWKLQTKFQKKTLVQRGTSCLVSKGVENDCSSRIYLRVYGPGKFSLRVKTSTGFGDMLTIWVDGEEKQSYDGWEYDYIPGTDDWQVFEVEIPSDMATAGSQAGTYYHEIMLSFTKDRDDGDDDGHPVKPDESDYDGDTEQYEEDLAEYNALLQYFNDCVWIDAEMIPSKWVDGEITQWTQVWLPYEAMMYAVVDLSGGTDAVSYPVRFTNTPPNLEDDVCRTTELWLRWIPKGTFIMGSPESELGRYSEETQHEVTLTQDFYIGVFECTQKQWELVMGSNPSDYKGDCRPVDNVSYNMIRGTGGQAGSGWPTYGHAVDATSFMGRLQEKTGLTFDLPTEAQWEYACRAGTTTAFNSGNNLTSVSSYSAIMDETGRYYGNQSDGKGGYTLGHTKVGSYIANDWGLYDMHGNVYEWCLDWLDFINEATAKIDPVGPTTGSYRLIRGGSWGDDEPYCRSAYRSAYYPSGNSYYFGFRVLCLP
jgi:formylglycine-generating enzyme required for sulfatase activity